MQTVTVQSILDKQIEAPLGHLLYAVRDAEVCFYVGQSRRDVITRFWEHLQKPSPLGRLISLNQPASGQWAVDFYTLADCRPFVSQKSLFSMQAWEHFDMDMAEQGLIARLRPALNRDFNPQPTPLPARYAGHHLASRPVAAAAALQSPRYRLWLNRMSLAGWVYERDVDGRITWHHADGRTLPDAAMIPYRENNRLP